MPEPPGDSPSGAGAPDPAPSPRKPGAKKSWQAPKGTRDFYPADMLRRRYIIDAWRRVSLRHGFEEIDGPTFEDAELYTVKSGQGILNELFGAYSGKDPDDTKQVQSGGPPPFALRPEFTPTLARMFAARAKQLGQPTKWFCVSNFFRAERPQRGRLREFWQWNLDVLGGEGGPETTAEHDIETIGCMIALVAELGLSSDRASARFNHRGAVRKMLQMNWGVPDDRMDAAFEVLDGASKLTAERLAALLVERVGLAPPTAPILADELTRQARAGGVSFNDFWPVMESNSELSWGWSLWGPIVRAAGLSDWLRRDVSIARGLAYYTGTVFELIAQGERAVAGGGRYDRLIELFGGPPTPAVGFGMGDVVLTNLLDDHKLMPEGRDLLEACARPLPMRCDVFVIANEKDESQAQVAPLVARLRRGVESEKALQRECRPWSYERYTVPPLHARRSYKATRNIGKLLSDASACHARYACIIESAETCTLKNLDTQEQVKDVPQDSVGAEITRRTHA